MAVCCGISVDERLVERWVQWVTPHCQPFFVADAAFHDRLLPLASTDVAIDDQVRDTFHLWRPRPGARLLWLTESTFMNLPSVERRRLVREQVRLKRGGLSACSQVVDLVSESTLRDCGDGRWIIAWPTLARDASSATALIVRYVDVENGGPATISHRRPCGAPAEG